MVFDVKFGENFQHKSRLFDDGKNTETPSSTTYISFVSIDSVLICLLAASLNLLNIQSCGIEKSYLMSSFK